MQSIDRLVAEHDLIERGLQVLAKAVDRIDSGQLISSGQRPEPHRRCAGLQFVLRSRTAARTDGLARSVSA